MSFRITSEFLNTLDCSPQEWEELEVLAGRSRESKIRFQRALSLVQQKAGTITDMCLAVSLAFIEPESIDGIDDLNDLRTDHEKTKVALQKSAIGKAVITPTSSTELYESMVRPDFIGGIVYIAGTLVDPDAKPNVKHAALLIPGLGGIMEKEPKSLARVLSQIGYLKSYTDMDQPNSVLPSVPFKEAETINGTNIPLMLLFFKQ